MIMVRVVQFHMTLKKIYQKEGVVLVSDSCKKCKLHKYATLQRTEGYGNPNGIWVISHRPLFIMDLDEGIIPSAGLRLVHKEFERQGLTYDDVYYTSLFGCKHNQKVGKKDLHVCPYLWDELKDKNPRVAVLLGNDALQALTGHSGITKYRGTVHKHKGSHLYPTYSPNAIGYSPRYEKPFALDIAQAINAYKEQETQNNDIDIIYVNSLEYLTDLLNALQNAQNDLKSFKGALDLETTTFDYWRPESVVMTMGLCFEDHRAWCIPLQHPKSVWRSSAFKLVQKLKPYLEQGKWIGNNWKFDQKWMRNKFGVTVNFGPDNMLLGYANDENIPHGLKFQAAYRCGAEDYASEIKWPDRKQMKKYWDNWQALVDKYLQMDLHQVAIYNAWDAYYSREVYEYEKRDLLNDQRMARIYKFLLEAGSKVFVEIEENGIWIDPDRLKKATYACIQNRDDMIDRMNKMLPETWIPQNLTPKQQKYGFNWNSTKQLGELLFSEKGFNFPVQMKTDKGAPSTAESAVLNLNREVKHPILMELLQYRKWNKYYTTYLVPWAAKIDPLTGSLHPTFKLHGTVTGRLSAVDGVHQIPRDPFIRSLVGAPPGWSFLEADYSQIELRVASIVANERTMRRIYITGGDIHTTTAAKITGKLPENVTQAERKAAKAVNFGFIYGMGAKKFQLYAFEKYGVEITLDEAKAFRESFFELYHDVRPWHERSRRVVRELGYVVSPLGRKRRLPNIFSNDRMQIAAAEREAINSPVQGMGSDINLAALVDEVLYQFGKYDPDWRESLKPLGMVHDAQFFMVRNDKLDFWPAIIKAQMEDTTRLKKWFNFTMPLPVIADLKIGTHYGGAKEWQPGTPLPFEPR